MKTKPITSIDKALLIFYRYPEIGNAEIKELFGVSHSTASSYKKEVKIEQIKREVKTSQHNTIDTRVAYDVWGIDVDDLERRRKKLSALGMSCT